MYNSVDKIMIVGGGSAGWMTAATLIKTFPNKKITLIESPNIPTVGVGESTIGGIKLWTSYLGIDDKEFLKHTDGSYKLSIKFTDFKLGEGFHYPFGDTHIEDTHSHLNDWWFKKWFYPETPQTDYADCIFPQMALVNQNKISYNENNNIPFNFHRHSAYHFDATKFGLWLRDHYCKPRGVNHILEDVNTVEMNDNGVESLNGKHKADLYIDCTGFKSLLLGKSLQVPFESYSDMLPNNSAWATRKPYKDKRNELVAYTNCTAIENGWVWNIPLWSRIGTGYVYSDKFVDDDTALKQFQKHLGTDELEFKKIKMRVGIHEKLWHKNVAAIGLSAGFIEPLESNGLFSVHEFVIKLVRALNREKVSQWDKDNYTFQCKGIFRNFAEFVAMHYGLAQRTDTEYWRNNFNKEWLREAKARNGIILAFDNKHDDNHFSATGGLHAIATGLHYSPTELDYILYVQQKTKEQFFKEVKPFIEKMNKRRDMWKDSVKDFPILYDFLLNNIYHEDNYLQKI